MELMMKLYGLNSGTNWPNLKQEGDCINVYYDGFSFYSSVNDGEITEGYPKFDIVSAANDKHPIFSTTPKKLHYGSATVGGITTGGFYFTGGTQTISHTKMLGNDKVRIMCTSGNTRVNVEEIKISSLMSRHTWKIPSTDFKNHGSKIQIIHAHDEYVMRMGGALSSDWGEISKMHAIASIDRLMTKSEATAVLGWIDYYIEQFDSVYYQANKDEVDKKREELRIRTEKREAVERKKKLSEGLKRIQARDLTSIKTGVNLLREVKDFFPEIEEQLKVAEERVNELEQKTEKIKVILFGLAIVIFLLSSILYLIFGNY